MGPDSEKQAYLDGLQRDIREYLDCNPQCTLEELRAQFGAADSVAGLFGSLVNDQELASEVANRQRTRKRTARILIALAALLCVGVLVIVGCFYLREAHKNDVYRNGYFVETTGQGPLPPLDPDLNAQVY